MAVTPDTINHLRVATVLHYYATGPGQELHAWLRGKRCAACALLEHPFQFSRREYARLENCENGVVVGEQRFPVGRLPMPIRYCLDFLRTVSILRRSTWDAYVGNGCFDTLAGIVLRRLGKVRRVVLYTIDYAPNAGGSRLYAWLYRKIDRFCCYHADAIWNLSRRMMMGRWKDGTKLDRCAKAIWVPHGTHARRMRHEVRMECEPQRVAFFGHVQEKSGVQLFIEAMPELTRDFPALHLDILGDGPYRPALERLAARLHMEHRVTFHGFIENHDDAEKFLVRCGIGLALYVPGDSDFSQYADPGKPKVYLACGLPVVIVGVPEVADLIDARGAGRKIEYDRVSMCAAITDILRTHGEYRSRALSLADEYDWDAVFSLAWHETL